jgi:hypothetical protein
MASVKSQETKPGNRRNLKTNKTEVLQIWFYQRTSKRSSKKKWITTSLRATICPNTLTKMTAQLNSTVNLSQTKSLRCRARRVKFIVSRVCLSSYSRFKILWLSKLTPSLLRMFKRCFQQLRNKQICHQSMWIA